MAQLVDSHCHLDFPDFDGEHEALIERAAESGVTQMVTICTRLKNVPQVQEIAEKIHINSTYLGEVLKKVTGKTPKEILSERIVLEAKSLLHNTDLSINEVSYFLKFQDPSNFTKFFKSKTGDFSQESRRELTLLRHLTPSCWGSRESNP